jgi:hypothetical protein
VVNRERRVEPRRVAIGLEAADRVEITSGLSADDMVVIGNRAQLKAGALVVPKAMNPAAAEKDAR